MKLHFEPDLEYQWAAIEAVCDLFRGQEICRTDFTVTRDPRTDLGTGNRLQLLDEALLANLQDVQIRNGLEPATALASRDFTVEMETGTGKTYVYLRTIFELNKRYGFTKFVIVVPSVAIKEGIYKTLQITEDHLRALYANTPFEFFLYDSAKPGQVRHFSASPHIQIMVVTVGAINKKDVNNLYKGSEKTGGEKPIDLITATLPVVIVDEPQSVDGGLEGQGKQALALMTPLCTLRYSATHAHQHAMIYRLDAVDAYERGLVKQIEVASIERQGGATRAYVRLISTSNKRGSITATFELDVRSFDGVKREARVVQDGDDLQELTGRAVYANCRVGEIRTAKGAERVEVRMSGGEHWLEPGVAIGDLDRDIVMRLMIRRTIKEHLDKELRLRPRGIKVLSLFFLDAVSHYRIYVGGKAEKGNVALMFEDEYRRFQRHPEYQALFREVDLVADVADVHDGYFSIDKKDVWTDTAENNQGNRDNAERAYGLIMKDKERLLSIDTKLKFIFSHSALREGWDNPNVFQICALREMGTERERRQTIGRGLRLCVNQEGERLRGFDPNTLTIVATESYEQFAENLQKEIEQETGIRFGIVEKRAFAGISVTHPDGRTTSLGAERSTSLWTHLKEAGYVDANGKVQDALRVALKDGSLHVPAECQGQLPEVREILRKLAGTIAINNANERPSVKTPERVLDSPELQAAWDRINAKTTYRVQFDNGKLIDDCAKALADSAPISTTRVHIRKAEIAIGRGGVEAKETSTDAPFAMDETDVVLPDLLTDLEQKTQLTRRSVAAILTKSERLDDFKRNPQQFIERAAEAIRRTKRLALADGIRYQRIGHEGFYAQELFDKKQMTAFLNDTLAVNGSVKVFAKLPGWFRISTPLGSYTPDSAVLVEQDGRESLFFGLALMLPTPRP